MIRKNEKPFGRGFLPAVLAGAAAVCFLLTSLPHRAVYAEDTVVADTGPAMDEAPVQEEPAAANVDPIEIEGLFEVISDTQGYAGESAEDPNGKKDKKKNAEKKLIVGYKQVGAQASIHFEMGEKPSLSRLQQQFPSKLDVYFLGEKKPQSVNVTWESYGDDYSSTNLNYYFFTPKFDSGKYEVKGLNLQSESPYIEVIQNAFTYEMIDSAPPKENEAAVVKYCREKLKLNTAATCGILANIYCESGFRTNAIGDGGTSVGICQWHNGRWTNLRNFAPDDWQTLEGQLRFMRKELRSGYRATLDYIRNVSDDEQGAYDAAYYWCMHYEMPDKIVSRSTTRGYLAKNVYWKRYGLGEEDPGAETEPEEADDGTGQEAEDLTAETENKPEENVLTAEAETEEAETEGAPGESVLTEKAGSDSEQAGADDDEKAAEKSYAGEYRCISDDGLFIRREKTTDSEAVGSIPFEGTVTVLSGDGEWGRVSYDGKEGFSKLEYLERIPDPEAAGDEKDTSEPSIKKKKQS